jgi:tetratricopeptide (TPR) repeat protein
MRSCRTVTLAVAGALCGFALQVPAAHEYFEKARRFFDLRQWDEAQANASMALAANPQMGDAETLLGLVATARSQFADAEKHFVRAVVLQPANYQGYAYLGSTYMQQKRLAEAAGAFRKVLELNPGNASANYNLGLIALERDAPAEALNRFQIAAQKRPSDVPALVGVLESQLLLRKKQQARQTALRIGDLLGDRDPRLFQVATLLAQHGEPAAAIPLMERSRHAFPESYDVNYNLALARLQASQPDRAAQLLQPFTGPQGRAEVFDLLGAIEEKRGRAVDAERAFREAVQRNPSDEGYRFDYCNALTQHGKLEDAVANFRTAVWDLPKSWKLRVGLGSAFYLSGDYENAAEALLEAVLLKPDAEAAYFLLGEAYDTAPLHQPAIESTFAAYLKNGPHDAWAYYHHAAILFARAEQEGSDDFRAAAENLNQALRIEPTFAEAYLQLGLIELAQGRTNESIAVLEKAISLNPGLAAAHYRLGLAYQRNGNAARSKEELDRFRALKNTSPNRGRVLESLASMSR